MAKSALERAEDVASERKRASSAELVELVRAVNPTGRELPAKIESERYRLKSRLQSLLVLRFGAELDVERTDDPAVVGLRHRATGADACHARIDDLDDEARSWVRFQLDTAGSEESRGSSAGSTRPRDDAHARRDALDPLSQGRRALEEYDFDGAREAFERALRDGMQDAGVALLEMLVDSLADFAAAIALEPRLGKLNGRSATLLALAHARSGARAEARRRVDALDDPRVPDVWAALVSSALAEGPLALDEATTFAREARERNVRHPELIEAEVTLARRLAERRAPEEAALRESWARGDEADAERIARAIGGPEAGRILQELDRRRNDAEGRRLLEEARESFAAGGDPAALVRRAAERGVRDESLDTAIATRAAASAERAREERADWITAHLAERVGLRAFLDEGEEMRSRVRSRSGLPILRWVEALGSPDAALALQSGKGLERHEALLSKIPEGREALRASREAAAAARRAESEAILSSAIASAAAGEVAEALANLRRLDTHLLQEERRVEAEALRVRLERQEAETSRETRVAAARNAGDRLTALWLARGGGPDWEERAASLASELAREWLLTQFECDVPIADAGIPAIEEASSGGAAAIGADGRLHLALDAGEWTVLLSIEPEGERIVRVIRLRAPFGAGARDCVCQEESLWILGSALALELRVQSAEIVGALRTAPFVGLGETSIDTFLAGGWLWVNGENPDTHEISSRVVDVRQRRVRHEPGDLFPEAVPGSRHVLGLRGAGTNRLFDARGTAITEVALPAFTQRLCASPLDSGAGFIALVGDEEDPMEIAVLSARGAVLSRRVVDGGDAQRISEVAASKDGGLVFACVFSDREEDDREARELIAWRAHGSSLERLWSHPVPRASSLVSDPAGTAVWLVAGQAGSTTIRRLGAEPPAISVGDRQPSYFEFPALAGTFVCRRRDGESGWSWTPAELIAMRGNPAEVDRLASRIVSRPAELAAFLDKLRGPEHRATVDGLLTTAEKLHPGDPDLALARAEAALADGRFAEAAEGFRALDGKPVSIGSTHLAHLRGLAQFLGADVSGARRTWEAVAEADRERCGIDRCLALLAPEGTPIGSLAAAITAADATEDPAGRIRLLSPHYGASETQSRARFAQAWLECSAEGAFNDTRKLLALGKFAVAASDRDLPLPGAAWSAARVNLVKTAAQEWLRMKGSS